MKIYTKTGDAGDTSLFGGKRVSKAHMRVNAYGDADELVSLLGVVCSQSNDQELIDLLQDIQLELFLLNSELATPSDATPKGELISEDDVVRMETEIDRCDEEIPPLRSFILPGGSSTSAMLQWARTVCRRAERSAVELSQEDHVRPLLVRYLNRLSDLLFALGRRANYRENVEELLVTPLRQRRQARKEEQTKETAEDA
ncbi:MAG: cob(I)yrinic acid a,c-diamide adenosyltransferase [Deltaproteobacteria bacterium]|nr:MAG: cob(I)yrinic acid a,c-diamide adenosyltransferase [Deltaproteobacteria bacterium]